VCENPLSTIDNLVYAFVQCSDRHPSFINLCPNRRFCQAQDQSYQTDKYVFTGMLGRPGVVEPVLFFTIQSPYTRTELLTTKRNATTGVVSFEAYVSNLYDNASPRGNKAWAHIEFASYYANQTAQLTKLRFLDAVEGTPENYFHDNHWWSYDAAPAFSCAGWNGYVPTWSCQAYRVYNPHSNMCEPGCNNGLLGSQCNQQDAGTSSMRYNATTTLYRSYDGNRVVCNDGYMQGYDQCVPDPNYVPYIPPDGAGNGTAPVQENTDVIPGSSDTNTVTTIVTIVSLVVGGGVVVGMIAFGIITYVQSQAAASTAASAVTAFTAGKQHREKSAAASQASVLENIVVARIESAANSTKKPKGHHKNNKKGKHRSSSSSQTRSGSLAGGHRKVHDSAL